MRARDVIDDAYGRMNRLSPGETLGDDEASFAFARLNALVDELSAPGQILHRISVAGVDRADSPGTWISGFASQTTDYTSAAGWKSALASELAVRLAPPVLGGLPMELVRAAHVCMLGVDRIDPAIVDVGYTGIGSYGW